MGDYGDYGFPISTLFWGALVFLALFVSCLLVWKAIERLRNNLRKFDGAPADEGHPKDPKDPWDQAISRPPADHNWVEGLGGGDLGGLGSMSQREQEDLFSTYAPRRVRKEMQRRRTAREQAQKHQNKS